MCACDTYQRFIQAVLLMSIFWIKSTFRREAKWIHTSLRFQTGVKISSVHTWSFISAAFQNDPIWACVGISFRVLFRRYLITSWTSMITRNEISFLSKWPRPALSFKRTWALNATSKESAFIHFVSGKLCSHGNLMPIWNFISVKMTDMKFIPFWVSFRFNLSEQR